MNINRSNLTDPIGFPLASPSEHPPAPIGAYCDWASVQVNDKLGVVRICLGGNTPGCGIQIVSHAVVTLPTLIEITRMLTDAQNKLEASI